MKGIWWIKHKLYEQNLWLFVYYHRKCIIIQKFGLSKILLIFSMVKYIFEILLFRKDTINWSKVTYKNFYMVTFLIKFSKQIFWILKKKNGSVSTKNIMQPNHFQLW